MVFQVPEFWGIAGDSFQIFLYLLMLGFFVRNRAIHKKHTVNKTKNVTGKSFNAHVFNITVQQQVDHAFANIIETIAVERNGLESVLRLNPSGQDEDDIYKAQSNFQLTPSPDKLRIKEDRSGSERRYDKVRKLSAKGLNARKISEELNIPMGEVELVLSLQQK